jgi:hypothetical protein
MQDKASPCIHHDILNYLNNEYGNNWIGRNGPVAWAPKSPDPNPPKTALYLWIRILHTLNQIRNDPELLTSVKGSLLRRLQAHIENTTQHDFSN